MLVYDIRKDKNPPYGTLLPGARLIRCVYDHTGWLSRLEGHHLSDGVHIYVYHKKGLVSWMNDIGEHDHAKFINDYASEYAKVFNTKKFIVEYYKHGKEGFWAKRYPNFTFTGYTERNQTRLELDVID